MKRLRNSSILVTGGCGFIGSQVVKLFNKFGDKVIVLDNLSTGEKTSIPEGTPLYEADIGDKKKVVAICKKHKISMVMHLAASINVIESLNNPEKYYENNYHKTTLLWEACGEAGVDSIIYSSTAAVYGNIEIEEPITEEHPTNPISPYGDSKLKAEESLKKIADKQNIRYAILRYFNVVGADSEGEIGQNPAHAHHLVQKCLEVAGGKSKYVPIYGTNFNTKDGTALRDYIHVLDVARAHLFAANWLRISAESDVFNVGIGKSYSVKEVVDAVERVTGRSIATQKRPAREGETVHVEANSKKLQKKTGWKPIYTDIHDMVKHAWEWYEKQL